MLKVIENCKTPTRGTQFSAGIDLYAREDITIEVGETAIIPLGVMIDDEFIKNAVKNYYADEDIYVVDGGVTPIGAAGLEKYKKFMKSHVFKLYIRSSLTVKNGLIIANGTGIIDMDYNKEIGIIICNPFGKKTEWRDGSYVGQPQPSADYKIKAGDKVAQIILEEHKSHLFEIDSDIVRNGGYGSTGGSD